MTMGKTFKYGLGDQVTDPITGFTGAITSRTEYLHGHMRYCVESLDREGKVRAEYFDEDRLVLGGEAKEAKNA
jgi:hypothetical protein